MDNNYFNTYTPHTVDPELFKNYNLLPDIQIGQDIPTPQLQNYQTLDTATDNTSNIQPQTPNYTKLSFEDLVKQENLPIIITSGYRGTNGFRGGKTASGKVSNHSKVDVNGNSLAVDIQPSFGKSESDFEKLRQIIYTNPRVLQWFKDNNKGILEENTQRQMAHYGASGPNWHVGPDSVAVKNFNNQLALHGIRFGKEGMELPNLSIYTRALPKINPAITNIPDFDITFPSNPIISQEEPIQELISEPIQESEPMTTVQKTQTVQNPTYHFGNSNNKEQEFASIMVPIFGKALYSEGIQTSKDNLDNLVRQAALESNYGLDPRGKSGFNLSGIKWYKGCIYGKTKGVDGQDYIDFPSLEDYAKYKVRLLNNKYDVFNAKNTTDFVDRLHGNNSSKANYSASKDKYLSALNNMKTLNQYLV